MMGALFLVGMKRLSLEDLQAMLDGVSQRKVMTAPASGLVLKGIQFSETSTSTL
jgi:tRNA U38,U39,U40 pseudouridine synthase TruA